MGYRTVLLGTFAVFIAACGSRDEVARTPSPDGQIEAVLIETNGGATTDFGYEIRVLGKDGYRGDQVAWLYGAVRSDSAGGVNLKWASDTELIIEYLRARAEKLEKNMVHLAGRDIRIVLRGGVTDPAAPAGGMLYNLDQKREGGAR